MKVKEYLEQYPAATQVTFIKAMSKKDANTPFYHSEYQTTPIHSIWEWDGSDIMDYLILNNKQHPIEWLSGTGWGNWFNKGHLISLLVISQEDLDKLYNKEQGQSLIKSIDEQITKR